VSEIFLEVGPVRIKPKQRVATVSVIATGAIAGPPTCSLDGRAASVCPPTVLFSHLTKGQHTLVVEATPSDGSPVDLVTKVFVFTGPAKKSTRHSGHSGHSGHKHGGKRK